VNSDGTMSPSDILRFDRSGGCVNWTSGELGQYPASVHAGNYRWAALALVVAGLAARVAAADPRSALDAAAANQAGAPPVKPLASAITTNSGPRIQFAEPLHDFGRVEYGKVLTNFFAFTNQGDQPLEISDVVSSCGCVAARNWDRRLEPGKSGTIPVIFNATGIGDNVMKPIRIACNDTTQSNPVLYVQAKIYKPIDAIPPIAFFNFGPDSQTNQTRVIRLISNLEEPVILSQPVWTNSSFRAELKTVKPGKEYELSVTVIPPLGPGTWLAPMTMKTDSSKMPVVNVSAYAMVQPVLVISPPRVMLPPAPLAESNRVFVTIQSSSTNSLVLYEPSLDCPGAQIQLRELRPGRVSQLVLTFPAGFRIPPNQQLEARVRSNLAQEPVIRVPVLQTPATDLDAPPDEPATAPKPSLTNPPTTAGAAEHASYERR
jgi:Protein of unknown function (DUF1573)